MFEILNWK